jgi:hypothetical protein
MTLVDFLAAIRRARKAAARQHSLDARQAALDGPSPPQDRRYKIAHSDCRTFRWPDAIDVVATDPVWSDLDAYRWLADFSSRHLKSGGLLFVQYGPRDTPDILDIMRRAGLAYVWTLNICCSRLQKGITLLHPFLSCVRPVLLMSKGDPDRRRMLVCSDAYTPPAYHEKELHPLQQPVAPWRYWLSRLTQPGDLIADPFAGSATVGVACKEVGARRYVGTETAPGHAKVARRRLAQTQEGTFGGESP